MFGKGWTKLPAVVTVQPQTFPDAEVLVTLTELANLTTREDLLFRGLEVAFCD